MTETIYDALGLSKGKATEGLRAALIRVEEARKALIEVFNRRDTVTPLPLPIPQVEQPQMPAAPKSLLGVVSDEWARIELSKGDCPYQLHQHVSPETRLMPHDLLALTVDCCAWATSCEAVLAQYRKDVAARREEAFIAAIEAIAALQCYADPLSRELRDSFSAT